MRADDPPGLLGPRAVGIAVAAVAVAALAGAVLAVRVLAGGAAEGAGDGSAISTSFGRLSVLDVETLRSLTAKDLAGMTHFPSYVGPDEAQVEVALQLANTLDRTVRVPAGRMRLRVGEGPALAPSASTAPATELRPGSAVTFTLVFVAPRPKSGRSPLRLEVGDAARPALVDLAAALRPGPDLDQASHDH